MGGVIIIFAILIPLPGLLGKLSNIYMILMLITTIWLDRWALPTTTSRYSKRQEGLHGKFKIIGQVGLGLIVGLTLLPQSAGGYPREHRGRETGRTNGSHPCSQGKLSQRRPPSRSSRATTWIMQT